MAKEREQWGSRTGFVMAAIGSAVGLGNVWRFPYVCYQNGGGAFLIPYFVALITAGIPLMILEYGLGHMMRGGAPLSFSKVDKKYEWIGWWALLVGFVVVTYYAVVMSWCFNYFVHSFTLRWGGNPGGFFEGEFLGKTDGPSQLGGIRLPVLIGLVLTWASIYLIIFKGIKVVGKVVMLTVPIPLMIIAILVIRGLTLPGALDGLNFYLTPDFAKLRDPEVWLAAYGQVFFTLSIAFGIMIAYASYVPEKSDVTNNAFITSLGNCGTSFFAGFAVFSTLGYLAQSMEVGVEEVVAGGPGLAFVTYPAAINQLPFWAPFFGALFFILLLTLGIDSAFSLVEAGVAGGVDKWGISRRRTTTAICGFAFLVGIIFTTRGGLYWLDIVDHFATNFGLTLVGLTECIVIGWVFGAGKLRRHLNDVSEIKVGRWWDVFIKIVTPAILVTSFVRLLKERLEVPYGEYPHWALLIGGWGVIILIAALAFILMKIKNLSETHE